MHKDTTATFHLTPSGWIEGDVAPPQRVETWSRSIRQLSSWSREYIDWRCIWVNPDMPAAERDDLRKKYRQLLGSPGRFGGTIVTIDSRHLGERLDARAGARHPFCGG
jgi:hypothetical protein